MTPAKEDQVRVNLRIVAFLQKIIFYKTSPHITHKESIDTKTYFISRLLTLVGSGNVVAMAPYPIISAKFSLENSQQINFSKSEKVS